MHRCTTQQYGSDRRCSRYQPHQVQQPTNITALWTDFSIESNIAYHLAHLHNYAEIMCESENHFYCKKTIRLFTVPLICHDKNDVIRIHIHLCLITTHRLSGLEQQSTFSKRQVRFRCPLIYSTVPRALK